MAIVPTFPGVYIEEIASGTRVIAGAQTSVTAFVGRAVMGPVGEPLAVMSFAEYEGTFGGLSAGLAMSYAVRDFFANGGGQAVVVRLVDGAARAATATLGPITLAAIGPGTWANGSEAGAGGAASGLRVEVTAVAGAVGGDLLDVAISLGTAAGVEVSESFPGVVLTGMEAPNRIDRVFNGQSKLVRVEGYVDPGANGGALPTVVTDGFVSFSGGVDSGPIADVYAGDRSSRTGLYALERVAGFNILCIPPDDITAADGGVPAAVWTEAASYCVERRAMLIAEPPQVWSEHAARGEWAQIQTSAIAVSGDALRNVAVYFPRVYEPDPLAGGAERLASTCGLVAGVWAATDAARGVWKAPAGVGAGLSGISRLEINLTDQENGVLNPLGINCLREFPAVGAVIWGARTLWGTETPTDGWTYINVRRLTLFLEESLMQGTRWVVFAPNDESLWSELRLQVETFLSGLARQGAFYDYFVKCDATTTTQADIDRGVVNVQIGFAPVRPAEFIVLQISQMTGQAAC